MSLTNDSAKIVALLEDSDSDNEDSQPASDVDIEDHVSERSNDSESEQEASDGESDSDNVDLATIQQQLRQEFHKGKDGTMWKKAPARPNVRTRPENILSERPGVKPAARGAKTELECWELFITHEMLCKIQTIYMYVTEEIRVVI